MQLVKGRKASFMASVIRRFPNLQCVGYIITVRGLTRGRMLISEFCTA